MKESIAYSWKKTKGRKQVSSFFRLIWLVTFPVLLFTGIGILLYLVQLVAEPYLPDTGPSYWLAVVCYAILKLAYYGVVALFMMGFVSL
ncbi:glycerophosphoryl diester phosphodiesterase membrane domain-containing protein, partial [Streptococcus suis]|uniref:glycerophosphoryl diester phosphodiesterase membrane domain-containing protein n=1 Tax=Streptococcus suis TaxID=1307 RepID=UPI001EE0E867